MPTVIDLTGRIFGKLLVVEKLKPNKHGKIMYRCECGCGVVKDIIGSCLSRKTTKSCGKCSTNTFYEHPDGYMVGITTKGEEFLFDKEDFGLVKNYSWVIANGYVEARDKIHKSATHVKLSRLILNPSTADVVDHESRDTLDNRRGNLRIATRQQNSCNTKKRKNSFCSYHGVSFDIRYNKFIAQISLNSKSIKLGKFDTEVEAALAYNEAAKKYHGEFAKFNNIKELVV